MALKPKAVMGRPTLYRPEYCEMVLQHMKTGFSFDCFGAEVGVDRDTVYHWTSIHKDFSDAKKRGDQYRRRFYEKIGIDALQGKIMNFNATVWIFTMKNACGWRDKTEVETTDKSKENALKSLSDKEIKEMAKKLLEDEAA